MRNPTLLPAIFAFVLVIASGASMVPNGGGSPAKRAGAPDDGDGSEGNSGTCYDVGCHNTFPINSGSGGISVIAPAFYVPGDTVDVELLVDHPDAARYGFQITARGADGLPAGEWIPGETSRLTIGNPDYVTQKLASSISAWEMRWVSPPDESSGDVTFYFAGNGADGRFSAANDHVYTGTSVVALSTSAAVERIEPVVEIQAVYPNPAVESVTIRYASNQPVSVALFDLEGRLRIRAEAPPSGGQSAESTIDVSGLAAGVYVIRAGSGEARRAQALVIQR